MSGLLSKGEGVDVIFARAKYEPEPQPPVQIRTLAR